ncbi:two-component sensor histidine kinase [Longispora fulva]|uniref:histidine kinase n=1 Tax=Longispora fulva TaxID=619741 RepID=A0A8J7GH94_9ACTN|nr:sensor histidine kinase [Longispora fulva]MBG6137921.1 signal transduction histidine kinase [Longispora fulva]GIG60174.1 two-component sensor histidine kinase [Longispora fulva]
MRELFQEAGRALLRAVWSGNEGPVPNNRSRGALLTLSVIGAVLGAWSSYAVLASDTAGGEFRITVAAVLGALPLVLVTLSPLWAWRLGLVGMVFGGLAKTYLGGQPWPWTPVQIIAMMIVLFVVALRNTAGVVGWIALLTIVPIGVYVRPQNGPGASVAVFVLLLLGHQIGRRRQAQRRLKVEEGRTEVEHARRAVLEERTRIARELHDVVAHHLSMITVRAQTAPYRIPDLPEAATTELAELGDAAREALNEMRRLLGVLRSEDSAAERAPQPGLDALPGLLDTARAAGIRVDATVLGDAALPAGVSLTGYRIVQEALSNASRHAPGAAVRVEVRREARALVLDVHNGTSPHGATTHAGPGHGLVGMRERVGMLGGELAAGPTVDGGWRVSARLPCTDD